MAQSWLPEDQVRFPAPTWHLKLPLTPVLRDRMPSSGLNGHPGTHVEQIYMQVIIYAHKIKKLRSILLKSCEPMCACVCTSQTYEFSFRTLELKSLLTVDIDVHFQSTKNKVTYLGKPW